MLSKKVFYHPSKIWVQYRMKNYQFWIFFKKRHKKDFYEAGF